MTLAIIAAIAHHRVIGNDGKLPWHIPEDLKRFKRLTTGHALLMGRKTYESLGRPLPNRRNVILSSHAVAGAETYPSIPEALRALDSVQTVFIIGGGQIFEQTIEMADALYLTLVDRDIDGDTLFPPYQHLLGTLFTLVHREPHNGFTFEDYLHIR